jgi:uncharacterized protein (TIGR03435 family)
MKSVLLAVIVTISLAMLRAQTPGATATPGTFDVAAIKQNKSGEEGGRFGGPPARWTATNVPVLQFVVFAYQVQRFQVEGGPDWIRTDRYDINARAEGNFPATTISGPDPRRQMLKALLADRFKLAAHIESRERPTYTLVTARPDKALGPRLSAATTDCAALGDAVRRGQAPASPPRTPTGDVDCGISLPPGRITFGTQPLAQLAAALSGLLQRGVVDRTGLAGTYSGSVTYTPDNAPRNGGPDLPAGDANSASLFTAIQEQLGLKLEPGRGQVDVLVIDHVERPAED